MNAGVLVVGAGQAGVQLAVTLRELGHDGPITLAGAERHQPYQRPPLSKEFLSGSADLDILALRTPAFYAEQRIDLVAAERVVRVDLATSGAGVAVTDHGRRLPFDRLALTVGARPRRLCLDGADLEGVCYLRDIDDAARLRGRLAQARDVVVIGGGFIGLEAAAVARSAGRNVTVVEAADRLIPRSVAPVVSGFYARAHDRRGTSVRLSTGVTRIDGVDGRVTGVHLDDGTRLPADLVVVGVGVVPRTELAEQLGLACGERIGGIVVDEFARTSEPSIVAAGDCTVLHNPRAGVGPVRLESVPNAVAQARVAAATIVGSLRPYTEVPWFWSNQYDLKLQIAGLADGYDQLVVRGDPAGERFSVLYYRQGRLLAVNAVNQPADYLAVRRALTTGTPLAAHLAALDDVALKDLLVRHPSSLG
ncbi:FAD-dependent oxidoreductase [Dactylosporangium sp. AC04546]|uniref:NAD(P)/FAD-dependent oxidoreductase n=1 Tax=Dactylosporangium sp. AC04546 TaxID=2862460 RepID=UPI001EDF7F1B|nr:FAD-dependent oxidoreductase [Dactylosporangium sp. AC04546]WVK78860.1 FAD-dependent oxidoreductase [Dactylosporangium sp. AC04546]